MAEHDQDVRSVVQAEQALAKAHLNLDVEVFESLLHPGYAIIQPGGVVEGKAKTLASLRSGQRQWQIARSKDLDVRLYGDTAVVIGRWRSQGRNGDTDFDYSARFLSVWVREDGIWRNVAFASAPLNSAN
jgi:ketosteroid isomerase-like protein